MNLLNTNMNLFEFNGPREWLTFGCLCTAMTIESITNEGTKMIAIGKVIVTDIVDCGTVSEDSWIAELTKDSDWLVYKSNGKEGSLGFTKIDQVNRNLKRFVQKQLKHFCAQNMEIEHDFADDLTPSCIRNHDGTCTRCVLAVQKIL